MFTLKEHNERAWCAAKGSNHRSGDSIDLLNQNIRGTWEFNVAFTKDAIIRSSIHS